MPLNTEVGLDPGEILLHGELGTQFPPTQKGITVLHFSADAYCGQTVADLSNSSYVVDICEMLHIHTNMF